MIIYTKEELEEAKKVLEYDNSDSLPSWGWARAAQILATELMEKEASTDAMGRWTLYGYDNGVPVYVFKDIGTAEATRLSTAMGFQDRSICTHQAERTIIIPEEAVKRYVWMFKYQRDGD